MVAQARRRKDVHLYRDFVQAAGTPPPDDENRTESGESGQGPESKINRYRRHKRRQDPDREL